MLRYPTGDGRRGAAAKNLSRAHYDADGRGNQSRRRRFGRVTPLERALRERIAAEGPISVEAFMQACNDYYYATRNPLGVRGDFTTAPEISQMFGEMIGVALADCWKRAGARTDSIYVELGPGRGTLAADALRVMRSAGFAGEVLIQQTKHPARQS